MFKVQHLQYRVFRYKNINLFQLALKTGKVLASLVAPTLTPSTHMYIDIFVHLLFTCSVYVCIYICTSLTTLYEYVFII